MTPLTGVVPGRLGELRIIRHLTDTSPSTVMAPSRGPQPLARNLHVSLTGHKGAVNVARYSKGTAKYVLSGGQDRTVRLWNAGSGAEIKTFAAHGYEVLSITVCVISTFVVF